MSDSESNDTVFVRGFFLGALVGAAIGLWKAPRSGTEMRNYLISQGSGAFSQAERAVVGESAQDAIAEGKSIAQQRQQDLDR